MRFIAIDIKVAGNNPRIHSILEIGAVIGDFQDRGITGSYQCFVKHDTIKGEPAVIVNRADIIGMIGSGYCKPNEKFLALESVAQDFSNWLAEMGFNGKITFASRNFLNFGERFVKRIPDWVNLINYHRHRSLDVPAMYFDPCLDESTPSLRECMRRAGIYGLCPNRALGEAEIIKRLLYKKHPFRLKVIA